MYICHGPDFHNDIFIFVFMGLYLDLHSVGEGQTYIPVPQNREIVLSPMLPLLRNTTSLCDVDTIGNYLQDIISMSKLVIVSRSCSWLIYAEFPESIFPFSFR